MPCLAAWRLGRVLVAGPARRTLDDPDVPHRGSVRAGSLQMGCASLAASRRRELIGCTAYEFRAKAGSVSASEH